MLAAHDRPSVPATALASRDAAPLAGRGQMQNLSRGLALLRPPQLAGALATGRLQVRALAARGAAAPAPERANSANGARPRLTDEQKAAEKKQKARVLDGVLKDLNAKHGKNSIMLLGADTQLDVECVPTGALTLDYAMGGGFPKGRIIEIFGPESSGKTTLALQAIAAVQREGGVAAFIDAENTFNPGFAQKIGVKLDELAMSQPETGEQGLEFADTLVRSQAVDLVVVDSVSALTPKAELEGEMGESQIGGQARMMSAALRKISKNVNRCQATVIFINQLRQKIGVVYGNPEVTSGGQALKYYASVRLDVRKTKVIDGPAGSDQIGVKIKARCVKNKVAPPFRVAEFDILFDRGINTLGCLLDAAEKLAVVRRAGSWYYYGERRLEQGRERTMATLGADPELYAEVEALTKAALKGERMYTLPGEAEAAEAGLGPADDTLLADSELGLGGEEEDFPSAQAA